MPRPGLLGTTTLRLALTYQALFVGSVLVILALVYWFTVAFIESQTDDTIAAEIAGLNEQYRQRGIEGLIEVVRARSDRPATGSLYLVTTPDGQPLAGNLSRLPDARPDADGWIHFSIQDMRDADAGSAEARAVVFTLPGAYRLLVGRDLGERQAFERRLLAALAWGVGVTLALGLIGGVLVSRAMIRRLETINRTTAEIMAGRLDQRVPLRGASDEFDDLAGNLNAMLDRIQRLMQGMRQVTDGIAHDLRGPLTRLRGRMEMVLRQPADSVALRAAMQDAIAEADRLLAVFAALLGIAEAEAGTLAEEFQPVALGDLARRVADLYEPVADDRGLGFSLALDADPVVSGNDQLLSQAVANLVDNAVKYTPPGGTVAVRVASTADGGAVVTVADSGPGIPHDQRERVLERFVRLDTARATAGAGLGLSLASAIARLHGVRLELADNAPGLRASLIFPPTLVTTAPPPRAVISAADRRRRTA